MRTFALVLLAGIFLLPALDKDMPYHIRRFSAGLVLICTVAIVWDKYILGK